MQRTTLVTAVAGACLFSAAAFGIGAAMTSPATLMSPGDYAHERGLLDRATDAAQARCRGFKEGALAICRAEVDAGDRTRRAELDARYYGTVEAAATARLVAARAQFDVARVKCTVRPAEEKAACLTAARMAEAKAVAAAKLAST
jgi:hypothetical protein